MKKVIYYFSGTGNSMRAAYRIAATLGDTEIISMRCDPSKVSATDADLIGFVFPVYHWTLPQVVVQFVKELTINPDAYIFGVSTLIFANCISFEVLEMEKRHRPKPCRFSQSTLYCFIGACLMARPQPVKEASSSESRTKLLLVS